MIERKTKFIPPVVVIVMGVSGSGKTTAGAMLAGRLNWAFADGDDFHSQVNVSKMSSGTPLDDEDRKPWLEAIARQVDRWRAGAQPGVIACSALKRHYRDIIIGDRPDVRLVYLRGAPSVIGPRLAARHDHFMTQSMLASQLEALEEPAPEERAIVVDVGRSPAEVVDAIVAGLAESG